MTATGLSGEVGAAPGAAVSERLKKRADFLAVAKGRRLHTSSFTLQAAERPATSGLTGARIGLTVTKKTGAAVERNRIRRRLREAIRTRGPLPVSPSHDYVIVARREILSADFSQIGADLISAFRKIHSPRPPRGAKRH